MRMNLPVLGYMVWRKQIFVTRMSGRSVQCLFQDPNKSDLNLISLISFLRGLLLLHPQGRIFSVQKNKNLSKRIVLTAYISFYGAHKRYLRPTI